MDSGTDKVEGRGVLLHCQMDESKVVQNLPVKGGQVIGSLQAANGLQGERASFSKKRGPEVARDKCQCCCFFQVITSLKKKCQTARVG